MKEIDGTTFKNMIGDAAERLEREVETINALNVFPVPDGDTGTNMNLTFQEGKKQLGSSLGGNGDVGQLAGQFARGLLMGARGNSGVILSQLFRGFAASLKGRKTADAKQLAQAFAAGVETAYEAVMKPVEGTMLTVAKEAAHKAVQIAKEEDDIRRVLDAVVNEARKSLERTPELLPVLKEVGVVDSGGQGLLAIYESFYATVSGERSGRTYEPSLEELVLAKHRQAQKDAPSEIQFGYCTEFMIHFLPEKIAKHPFDESAFRNELSNYGDSLLVVSDDHLVKVHIHTEKPGEMLNLAQRYGELAGIKIDNMRRQHAEIVQETETSHEPRNSEQQKSKHPSAAVRRKKKAATVAVAQGNGLKKLLFDLGCDVVVEGGQSMNPSTEDLVKALKEAEAHTIYLLPNNKNIFMAAEQAAEVVEDEVVVIPTRTIPGGMAALVGAPGMRTFYRVQVPNDEGSSSR